MTGIRLGVLVCALTSLAAGGQTPSGSTSSAQAGGSVADSAAAPASTSTAAPPHPTVKVTTRLVQVNVVVHDHHGNPVDNLTKGDFEVKDSGKLREISIFSVDKLSTSGSTSGGVPQSAKPIPRNIVSNRPEAESGVPTSVTVVLFDTYNTKITDQAYARTQLLKFFKQIRPEDRIALYALNQNGFEILHDFTNNSEALETSIANKTGRFSHELDGSTPDLSNSGDDNMDTSIDMSNAVMANFFTRNRIINTCMAFKALADHLSAVPGRKNLVWLTGSVPIDIGFGDPEDVMAQKQAAGGAAAEKELFAPYFDEASTALNTANVAVYPVDARGLFGLPFVDASKNFKIDSRTHQLPMSAMRVDNRNLMTMQYVADLTGGKAFHDTNDLASAVRHAIDDSSVTYTLGYYVSEQDWDNRYHKIKVTVKRSGVSVRTKKGYLAEERPVPTNTQLDDLLHKAVWSPLDSMRLGVSARIDPSRALPNASRFAFVLDPSEIQFREDNGKYNSSLDVLFVQEKKRGQRVTDLRRTVTIAASPAQYQSMIAKGILLGEDLKIEPDTEAVRLIVMDRLAGQVGSVTIPVTAADKSASTLAAAPTAQKTSPVTQ